MDNTKLSKSNQRLNLQMMMENIKFINSQPNELIDHQCLNCHELAVYQYRGQCEHKPIICIKCFEKLDVKNCPECEKLIDNSCQEDSILLNLSVLCPFNKNGCQKILTLKQLQEHQETCSFSKEQKKQINRAKSKRLDSISSTKPQFNEELMEIKKTVKELQTRQSESERSLLIKRSIEKQATQITLLEEKLNKEINAKKEMEKRLTDQSKKKSDMLKQEMLKYISEQLNQQIDKQIQGSEKKVSIQLTANNDKLKMEIIRNVTTQLNQQVERQIQESRKKLSDQIIPKTQMEMKNSMRKMTDNLEQQFEKQLIESEKKILEKVSKKTDIQRKELSKNITEQIGQQTERKIIRSQERTTNELMKKSELAKTELIKKLKDQRYHQVEKNVKETTKAITHQTAKQVQEAKKMMSSELNQEAEILKQEVKQKLAEQIAEKIEDQKNELLAKLLEKTTQQNEKQIKNFQMETSTQINQNVSNLTNQFQKSISEQITQTTEKQFQNFQKSIDNQLTGQIKKDKVDVTIELENKMSQQIKNQVLDLQKHINKELKTQNQQIEAVNQKIFKEITDMQESNLEHIKKAVATKKEELRQHFEAQINQHEKSQLVDLNHKIAEELKAQKDDLNTSNLKFVTQLLEEKEKFSTTISKKSEICMDKLQKQIFDKSNQQLKVIEMELQKNIAKEVNHQRHELIEGNQQFVTKLQDSQVNATKDVISKAEKEKEKWIKYFEDKCNQQMKVYATEIQKQMLQDLKVQKQELVQANQQLVKQLQDTQEKNRQRFSKWFELTKETLLTEVKSQISEKSDGNANEVDSRDTLRETQILHTKLYSAFNEKIELEPRKIFENQDATSNFNKHTNLKTDGIDEINAQVEHLTEFSSNDISKIVNNMMEEQHVKIQQYNSKMEATLNEHILKVSAEQKEFVINTFNQLEEKISRQIHELDEKTEVQLAAQENMIKNEMFHLSSEAINAEFEKCVRENELRVAEDGLLTNESMPPELDKNLEKKHLTKTDHLDENQKKSDNGKDQVNNSDSNELDISKSSHFNLFEDMQRRVFNKQFGNLVKEEHEKVIANLDKESKIKAEEIFKMITEQLKSFNEKITNKFNENVEKQKVEAVIDIQKQIQIMQQAQLQAGAVIEENNDHIEPQLEKLRLQIKDEIIDELHRKRDAPGDLPDLNTSEKKEIAMEETANASLHPIASNQENVTEYTWRITQFNKKFHQLKNKKSKQIASSEIAMLGTPFKLKAHLILSQLSNWVSLVLGFVKPICSNAAYSHRRTFTLVDQSKNTRKMNRIFIREPGFMDGGMEKWMNRFYGPVCFAPIECLEKGSIYVKNDTLIIKIALEPMFILFKSIPVDDGVLYWKIENYAKHKQDEVDGLAECLYSDYFYTSRKGYRMQLRAYLNGDEQSKSEYLSLYLYFRRGKYDEFLSPRFPHKVTFTILDQSKSIPEKNFTKSMESDGHISHAYGFREFAPQSELESDIYLKNDMLLIKTEVLALPEI